MNTQYVFNKNSYECNPWYPQLEIIRPHHPEFIFGIPAALAEKLKNRPYAEKWLRTANIVNGSYAPGGVCIAPPAPQTTAPELEIEDDEEEELPPEFGELDPLPDDEPPPPFVPPPMVVKKPRAKKSPKNNTPTEGGDEA